MRHTCATVFYRNGPLALIWPAQDNPAALRSFFFTPGNDEACNWFGATSVTFPLFAWGVGGRAEEF